MTRTDFISLIGTKTLIDYPFGNEVQIWSMENFSYNENTDVISHNRLPLIMDVFIKKACNPHFGNKLDATHG